MGIKKYQIYLGFAVSKDCVIESIDNNNETMLVRIDGVSYTIKNCKCRNRVGQVVKAGDTICYALYYHIFTDIPQQFIKEDNLRAMMNAQKRRSRFKIKKYTYERD